MRTLTVIVLGLALWGCTQPADVELLRDGYESDLEVLPVVVPDTNLVVPEVDSVGVLPGEFLSLSGVMLVSDITHEGLNEVVNASYAQVFFADSAVRDPVGRMIGYSGQNLGPVTLNGEPMLQVPHRVILRRSLRPDTTLLRGFEYLADLTGRYRPGEIYTWSYAGPGSGPRIESITAPARVRIQSPPVIGQGVVERTRDLELLWQGGQGQMSIIISTYDPLRQRTRPLLELRSRANSGRALLPAKILKQLPPFQRYYVFTFVLASRRELRPGMNSRVLVQAASIVNRYVELR